MNAARLKARQDARREARRAQRQQRKAEPVEVAPVLIAAPATAEKPDGEPIIVNGQVLGFKAGQPAPKITAAPCETMPTDKPEPKIITRPVAAKQDTKPGGNLRTLSTYTLLNNTVKLCCKDCASDERSEQFRKLERAVKDSSPEPGQSACNGHCRWDVINGERWFHFQPGCPKHDRASLYDPAFARKSSDYSAVSSAEGA